MVWLLFKFSGSKLDEILAKSVSDCNQQPNKLKNSPRKKNPKAVKPRGGATINLLMASQIQTKKV